MKQEKQDLLKDKVLGFVSWWEPLLDLPGIAVEHRFHDKFYDAANVDSTIAETVYRWPYREAVVHWYLSGVARLDDTAIEEVVVHEYCHVLNGAVEGGVKERDSHLREISAENVCAALLSAASVAKEREQGSSVAEAFDSALREHGLTRDDLDEEARKTGWLPRRRVR